MNIMPILNIDDFPAEYIILYAFFMFRCQPEWTLNLKEVKYITGLNQKRVSAGVAYLENRKLIDVDRSVTGKPVVTVNEIPDHIVEKYDRRMSEIEMLQRVQTANEKIVAEMNKI